MFYDEFETDDVYIDIPDGTESVVSDILSDISEDELENLCDQLLTATDTIQGPEEPVHFETIEESGRPNNSPIIIELGQTTNNDLLENHSESSEINRPSTSGATCKESVTRRKCSKQNKTKCVNVVGLGDKDRPTNTNIHKQKTTKPTKPKWDFGKDNFIPPDCTWGETYIPPDNTMTPLEYFRTVFDLSIFELIAEQSNLYALQKDGKILNMTKDEAEQLVGIWLHMGIVDMPGTFSMYWSAECRYPPVADVMSRNRYRQLMRYFHLNDNTKMLSRTDPNYDKLFKVRPLLNRLLEYMKSLPIEEYHSVDEQIIPFKGRNHLKQYVKNKPHKWGYKVFTRAGASGIMYDFRIYQGKGTCNDSELGVSANIVLELCKTLPEGKNFKVFFDNWFSSLPLAVALLERKILCLGTVRKDRMGNCELASEDELRKEGRGSKDWRVEKTKNVALVRWMDRKSINFVSTYACVEPEGTCKRWSASDKKKINIAQPHIVGEYNKFMGGVDKADMLLELYRIDIRSRRWYMRIVFWAIGVAVVNSWLLYRQTEEFYKRKVEYRLLQFQSVIATGLTKAGHKEKKKRGRPSLEDNVPKKKKIVPKPTADVRYDEVGHLPLYSEKQGRCKNCPKGFAHIMCKKCNVNLCITKNKNCFEQFHSK